MIRYNRHLTIYKIVRKVRYQINWEQVNKVIYVLLDRESTILLSRVHVVCVAWLENTSFLLSIEKLGLHQYCLNGESHILWTGKKSQECFPLMEITHFMNFSHKSGMISFTGTHAFYKLFTNVFLFARYPTCLLLVRKVKVCFNKWEYDIL